MNSLQEDNTSEARSEAIKNNINDSGNNKDENDTINKANKTGVNIEKINENLKESKSIDDNNKQGETDILNSILDNIDDDDNNKFDHK